ncbi:hypothetical protein V2H45_03950 [Tumidithrix elongata RA019]|uniref:Arc-like DNA binding domain-containing protein n=1 Tax=Tumidithrix elongata BACA0141 TaxID=2716417 RepID=A0AAW9PZP7_9CYAN|nr:hypothetical protein [Tumidithrix elongata RA019]
MALPPKTRQINFRFPVSLLNLAKSKAEENKQTLSEWIVDLVERELNPQTSTAPNTPANIPTDWANYIGKYISDRITPLQKQITELRFQLGECNA